MFLSLNFIDSTICLLALLLLVQLYFSLKSVLENLSIFICYRENIFKYMINEVYILKTKVWLGYIGKDKLAL